MIAGGFNKSIKVGIVDLDSQPAYRRRAIGKIWPEAARNAAFGYLTFSEGLKNIHLGVRISNLEFRIADLKTRHLSWTNPETGQTMTIRNPQSEIPNSKF